MKYTFIRSVIPVAAAVICLAGCGKSVDAPEAVATAVEDAADSEVIVATESVVATESAVATEVAVVDRKSVV